MNHIVVKRLSDSRWGANGTVDVLDRDRVPSIDTHYRVSYGDLQDDGKVLNLPGVQPQMVHRCGVLQMERSVLR